LSSKDLRRNPIAIFNSILSARLICILDFIFAETTLNEPSAWLADCWSTTAPAAIFFPINNPCVAANAPSPVAKKKSNIAGVR